jgi:uncharacterized membrane protein
MTLYVLLKFLHVIGATIILGTGIGIAFFVVLAHGTRNAATIADTLRSVVIADFVFTATAVCLQPITGVLLMRMLGYGLEQTWIVVSLVLYILTGLFWLPVVWMQMRMRSLAREAAASDGTLPPAYFRLYRTWFAFGIPAFCAVVVIYWLMTFKPTIW